MLARDFKALLAEIAADQAERGAAVGEDAGIALAYEELQATRAERRHTS